ncbi:MAG: hypothetical protein ACMG6H_14400 [Acidobacteriota bacterium]
MRATLSVVICLLAIPTALARKPGAQPAATVAGIYENFSVGKGSGDLEGMRVVIVPAGGGYYAIVQIAQGGAEDPKPEFVEAKVKGMTVAFSVGDEKFNGTATAAGLRLKNSAGETQTLKRKACSSYFR